MSECGCVFRLILSEWRGKPDFLSVPFIHNISKRAMNNREAEKERNNMQQNLLKWVKRFPFILYTVPGYTIPSASSSSSSTISHWVEVEVCSFLQLTASAPGSCLGKLVFRYRSCIRNVVCHSLHTQHEDNVNKLSNVQFKHFMLSHMWVGMLIYESVVAYSCM